MFPQYSAWSNYAIVDLSTSATIDDYQVKLVLDIEPEMQVNIGDFRACTSAGDSLNYWIETIETSTFTVWMEVPIATQQIIFYWGNSQAVSESDGSLVFDMFDDFLGTSLGAAWTGDTASATVADSSVSFACAGANVRILSHSATWGTNYIFRSRARLNVANTTPDDAGYIGFRNDGNNFATVDATNLVANFKTHVKNSGAETTADITTRDTNYHVFEVVRNGSTNLTGKVDSSSGAASTNFPTANMHVQFLDIYNVTIICDWLLVRKYQATEPTISAVTKYSNSADKITKQFTSSNDIQVSKAFSSNSDILINKNFTTSNDILLSKEFTNSNDIFVYKVFSSSNNIAGHLNKLFSSSNDIQVSKSFSNNSDIHVSQTFTNSNDIIKLLSKSFSSSNDIFINSSLSSTNKINVSKIFSSSNDIEIIVVPTELDSPFTVIINKNNKTVTFSRYSRTVRIN